MTPKKSNSDLNGKNPPGNPIYSSGEDIYSQEEKETFNEEVTPDTAKKENNISVDEGLDVPGSELDDADEIIGEEDEENNYYSLGGDNHDDPDQ